ncbi:MAG TPA: type II toxin-antitoxin system RelE/ParE family toxin [Flavobacteriales bacterium]|nr:type II toxin-antitoxin system RelE/ParE family toxin [Flavobacteriales bacterium]
MPLRSSSIFGTISLLKPVNALADRITKKVVDDIDRLVEHPRGGQREPLLDHLGLGHRRLVSGHYKIIYRIIDDLIFISDIIDTRQDPEKMVW